MSICNPGCHCEHDPSCSERWEEWAEEAAQLARQLFPERQARKPRQAQHRKAAVKHAVKKYGKGR